MQLSHESMTSLSINAKYFNKKYGKHIGECTLLLDKQDHGKEYVMVLTTSTGLSYKSSINSYTFRPEAIFGGIECIEQQIIDDLDKDLPYTDRKFRSIFGRE